MMFSNLLLPEAIIAITATVVLILGLFLKEKEVVGPISILGILIALILTLGNFDAKEAFQGYPFYNAIVVDPLAQIFNSMFLIVALIVCIASVKYYESNKSQDEYYMLLLFALLGMMTVAIANDLIVLFIGFELASLSTYALAGFDRKDTRSVEAAFKYFVIGALSSAILLFGISIVYGLTGSTNLGIISKSLPYSSPAFLATLFVIAGFGFKMALVPFHMWAPDTYEGSPSVVTSLLAAGSKKMGFVAAFRVIILALIAMKVDWYTAFAVIAVATMTLGNLAALVQKSVKRMLAYSSIAHAGYIAIVFVVVAHSATAAKVAIAGGVLHAFSHAFAKGGAFIVTAMIAYMFARNIDNIDDYNGLGKRAPITALTMAILLCSLAGIPPTFGFYSKFVLFLSAIQGDLLWLAIIAVLNSAISVYYYARVIMRMYWGEPTGEKIKEPAPYALALVIATIGTLALGIYPSPVYNWAYAAAQSLIGGL